MAKRAVTELVICAFFAHAIGLKLIAMFADSTSAVIDVIRVLAISTTVFAGFALVNIGRHLVKPFTARKRHTATYVIDHVAEVTGRAASS